MQHPDYPFWAALSLILVLLPAPWHWRARNIATISLIMWLTLANLALLINAIIWSGNYADIAPIWCDISGYLLVAVFQAIPACSLSQMRRLASITSTARVGFSASERTQRMWAEIAICVFFPLIMLPLSYIVQGHRYDILENTGCSIPSFTSWPALAIRIFIPSLVTVASLCYAGVAMRGFLVRRLQFKAILAQADANLSVGRYLRLIALAISDAAILIFNMIVATVVMLVGTESYHTSPLRNYTSWEAVHQNYGQISQFPSLLATPTAHLGQTVGFYIAPLYSITFFLFFGFGEEAVREYVSLGTALISELRTIGVVKSITASPLTHITLGSKVITADGHSSGMEGDVNEKYLPVEQAMAGSIPVTVERSIV